MGILQSLPFSAAPVSKDVTWKTLLSKKDEILKWTAEHPVEDVVYHLKSSKAPTDANLLVVAGSAALHSFLTAHGFMKEVTRKWRDEYDTDVFVLNQKDNYRRQMGKTDLVHIKEPSVESLLLNFDLPCCRIATNARYEFWISAHCFSAIMTGRYSIPSYVKDYKDFQLILQRNRTDKSKNPAAEQFLYSRLTERINKYAARGFVPEYNPTSELLPWIRNRFQYAEWTTTTCAVAS